MANETVIQVSEISLAKAFFEHSSCSKQKSGEYENFRPS